MHYQHKIKCQACQLHFIVLSWSADWKHGEAAVIHCPECGGVEPKLVWQPEEHDEQIFAVVPGGALYAGVQ
jgi:NAD-dependent SIR2 family protein deacetylase